MAFPNIPDKHRHEAFFSPADFVSYARELGNGPDSPAPGGVILCYSRKLMKHVLAAHRTEKWGHFLPELHVLTDYESQVGIVGQFGIGAPAAVTVVEELIAHGVREFVSVGTAGSLQKHVAVGDIVVCDRAIRTDAGVPRSGPENLCSETCCTVRPVPRTHRRRGSTFHLAVCRRDRCAAD